jgi:hypothetical protein
LLLFSESGQSFGGIEWRTLEYVDRTTRDDFLVILLVLVEKDLEPELLDLDADDEEKGPDDVPPELTSFEDELFSSPDHVVGGDDFNPATGGASSAIVFDCSPLREISFSGDLLASETAI